MAFQIKQHDRSPSIRTVLGFAGNATVPVLTGATVRFVMRLKGSDAAPKVNAVAVVEDAATATIRYDWTVGDTDTSGQYEAEWEVTAGDGKTQTFPTATYDDVTIYEDLDGAA